MSINCANKQASMDAKSAIGDRPKTSVKVSLSTGELDIAGTLLAIYRIPIEKKEATIPAITT